MEYRKRENNEVTLYRRIIILFFICYSAFFAIGSILAAITACCAMYDLSGLITSFFMFSCHQQPDRSFWIFGYPIALCCRCLGFYSGVLIFGISKFKGKFDIPFKIFMILCLLVAIDITLNIGIFTDSINTGNITRFIIGLIMGALFVHILGNFIIPVLIKDRKVNRLSHYGLENRVTLNDKAGKTFANALHSLSTNFLGKK